MSQDERLPEELNDCERVLGSLLPRASRCDRDRLMIRLGEQSAARGSVHWKWATFASLMLALALSLRPALVPQGAAPTQLATESPEDLSRPMRSEASAPAEAANRAPAATVRPIDEEVDWLLALATGQSDPSRMLTVRRQSAPAVLASRDGDSPVLDDSPAASPPLRTPMLRWGDRPLRRDASDVAALPTS